MTLPALPTLRAGEEMVRKEEKGKEEKMASDARGWQGIPPEKRGQQRRGEKMERKRKGQGAVSREG